jgi:SdrD B-like domain
MRIVMVVAALIATPFAISVAQNAKPKAQTAAAPNPASDCKEHPEGNAYGWEHGQHDCGPVLGGISGSVFFDMSYDGVRDAGEAGIANWVISLSGPVNATTTTDAAGNYSFTSLPVGTYTVCEAQRFGWIQTAPQTESSCTSGFGYTIVITAGQVLTQLDFGNVG